MELSWKLFGKVNQSFDNTLLDGFSKILVNLGKAKTKLFIILRNSGKSIKEKKYFEKIAK